MAASSTFHPLFASLRRWLGRVGPYPATDAELVRRFAERRDEEAFAALVDRHGPMVLGVARRVVGDHHTAEDVFQATFVSLARHAARLRDRAALPAWLHQTARNIALTAVRARRRRDRAEAQARQGGTGDVLDDLSSRELVAILDEEVARLPERYRLPLVLCCLEGRTQEEAARLLGWTPGSVRGRLERGRQCLRDRLARRGLTWAIAVGVPLLAMPRAVAAPLRALALQAALREDSISAAVAALVPEAPRRLLPWAVLAAAAVSLTALGAGLGVRRNGPEEPPTATAAATPVAPQPDGPREESLPAGAVGRLGSPQLRIGNSAFALTPDGRTIVAVSPEGIVRTFDASTGRLRERRQLGDRAGADPVGQAQAQLSDDGRTAAIVDRVNGRARLTVWDLPSGKVVYRRGPSPGPIFGAATLSPDGRKLAFMEPSEGRDGAQVLCVLDLPAGPTNRLGPVEFNVYSIRFTADGSRIVVSQTSSQPPYAATLACFDVRAGKSLWQRARQGVEFALSPDGRYVLAARRDQTGFQVIETDPATGQPTERFAPCQPAHPNVKLLIAADNRTVVMNHFDGVLTWDLVTGGDPVRRFTPPKSSGRGYGPEMGALSRDGRTLVTNLGRLQRWELTTGKPLFEGPPDDGLGGPIERLAFTADGRELFASSWGLVSARWDLATGKRIALVPQRFGHSLTRTPDGLRSLDVDSFREAHTITVVDPVAGQPLQKVRWGEPSAVGVNGLRSYALTADGRTLLVAHGEEPARARNSFVTACDVATGRRRARFSMLGDLYFSRSPFSPCGRWAVLAGKLYHVGSGTALFAPMGEPGERLAPEGRGNDSNPVWFSDDGRLLAGRLQRQPGDSPASRDTLGVWELASGQLLARITETETVAQAAFSPDNRLLALVDGEGVRLVGLGTGKTQAAYAAPDVACDLTDRGCATQTLVFAPDGRRLATGHRDGSVLLWCVPAPPAEATTEGSDSEAGARWTDLGSDSPARARSAIEHLARRPAQATALLRAQFRPPAATSDPTIAALIKELDSDDFAAREAASAGLRALGTKAEASLRRQLAAAPTPEARRRIEDVLAALTPAPLRLPASGATLRGLRAIELLEKIRTSEARKLLKAWAEQEQDALLASEATTALGRIGPTK